MKILFITKRNNHGKYFKKIAASCLLTTQLHYIGRVKLNACRYLLCQPIATSEVVLRQITRKRQVFPKLLSFNLIANVYRGLLTIIEHCRVAKYLVLFHQVKPEFIGIWNGDKSPYHSIVLLAKHLGIGVIYFENGLLPNTTSIDFNGVNAKNSLPRTSEFYINFKQNCDFTFKQPQLIQRPHHKQRQQKKLKALPAKFIFVPLQVPNDSQIVVNSPWLKNMSELFNTLVKQWQQSELADHHLVFKAHPSWPDDFSYLDNKIEKVMFANDNPTEKLIRQSHAVITINSTVGIEALLYQKPVLTLGDACYNIQGIVLNALNEQQLLIRLSQLCYWQPNPEILQGFLLFLQHVYTIPERWSLAGEKHLLAATLRLKQEDQLAQLLSYETKQQVVKHSLKLNKTVNF